MPGLVHLLRCVGRAAVKNSGRALANLVPLGEVGFEIARDVCEEYRARQAQARLRAQLEEYLGAARPQPAVVPPADLSLPLISFLDPSPSALPSAVVPDRIQGRLDTYARHGLLAVGNAADVFLAARAGEAALGTEPSAILKIAHAAPDSGALEAEWRVVTELRAQAADTTYRDYLPTPIETFPLTADPTRRVNVFAHEPELGTLEQVHEQLAVLEGRHLAWIFNRLLTVLGFCHLQGMLHGAILPCHVLIHAASHALRLIGWGQSARVGQRIERTAMRYRDWYPPEVQLGRPASPATDLFAAARCMVYLAGGDPVQGYIPEDVPTPLRRFWAGCLFERASMRPHDAWALLDEFKELLRRLYGPPTFHPLTLS